MENVRPSFRVVSNRVVNPPENECDEDVVLIEQEIPIIDLCTPERQSRTPFANFNHQRFGTQHRVGQGNFFDRMNNVHTGTASSSSKELIQEIGKRLDQITEILSVNNSSIVCNTSANISNQRFGRQQRVGQGNGFDRMNNADTGTASEPPNNSSIVYKRSANHGKGPLQEFFDSLRHKSNNAPENPPVMCIICLRSAIGREPQATFCGHVFCKYCIERAMTANKECPTCKQQISDVHPLYI